MNNITKKNTPRFCLDVYIAQNHRQQTSNEAGRKSWFSILPGKYQTERLWGQHSQLYARKPFHKTKVR